MHSFEFKLIPNEEINSIIPLLQLLNKDLEQSVIEERLAEMITRGYECLGVYDDGHLAGICGIWTLTKVYVGRHIEPDNVVIDPDYRGEGIGELMLRWVEDYARSKGCIASELNAYVVNPKAHKFWINMHYDILGFHFQKKL